MSRKTIIWLVVASLLILIGCAIFGGVMSMIKWDFQKLSTVKYQTNTYEINDDFKDISINADVADIEFVQSEKASVVCCEEKKAPYSVQVKNGALVIEIVNKKQWYDNIGINFGTPKITVNIPKCEYGKLTVSSTTGDVELPNGFSFENIDITATTGDVENFSGAVESVKIKTSTGDICVEGISAASIDLSVSTGKVVAEDVKCEGEVKINVSTGTVKLGEVTCKKLISTGNTGSILLENVVAEDKFSIKRTTGNVRFEECDADEIYVKTTTGSVMGDLLSGKIFKCQTSTGSINVPDSNTGGKCEIETTTGNIKIEVQ